MSRSSLYFRFATIPLFVATLAFAQGTTRVSVPSLGGQSTLDSTSSTISRDGRFVAFSSADATLTPNDTNGTTDVFVHDLVTRATTRVSVSTLGVEGNGASSFPHLSADGRFVTFSSTATNFDSVDANGNLSDVFVHDRSSGVTERISAALGGGGGDGLSYAPQISGDGRYVVFHSYASNLVANDAAKSFDVFVRDRATGTTDSASIGVGGASLSNGYPRASISDDGRFLAYRGPHPSAATGVSVALLHDRQLGTSLPLAASPLGGFVYSEWPLIAPNGSAVAFVTSFNLLPEDQSFNADDIYVHDVATGTLSLASTSFSGGGASGSCYPIGFSEDGRYLTFVGKASNLVHDDTNAASDAFVRDRALGKTIRVSLSDDDSQAAGASGPGGISADGRQVAFVSEAPNLVVGDTNGALDVFVRRLTSPATVSSYGVGLAGTGGVVPTLLASNPPVLDSTFDLFLSNSAGVATLAVLFVGLAPDSATTPYQGTLLVTPFTSFALGLPAVGATIPVIVREDLTLAGIEFYAQALELDPGAPAGVSFTAGLKLFLGD